MIYPERDAKLDSGITSFSASTNTAVKIDTFAQEAVVRGDSGDFNPPPYSIAGPSSPPPTSSPSARVNHLYLNKNTDSVNGSYTVDMDLVVPPQLLPSVADGEALDNLKLVSYYGGVTADVVLVSQGKKRASLVAECKHGSIKFKLLSRSNCSFRLVAQGYHGGVRIYLPRDFVGPITSSTEYGALDLSDAVKQNYTPFSEDKATAKGFIGDWPGSGYGDAIQAGAEWTGDEIIAGSKHGRIRVSYNDELNAAGAVGGFFSSWFKGFT
ncbi:hypothetical protein M407DRAFT_28823 [Tulasnella calospora MUT 4182]|uniref:DUF7330 domain-containing protein n=1 Tax=Tulasnella calospora MUT 4182 TaxID=1051891 RepID=A0A0C3Q0Q8_9AGAM|nr:hypothetical protein M407DRAFT_28823 [Tulasnella calospora MUT 4182]